MSLLTLAAFLVLPVAPVPSTTGVAACPVHGVVSAGSQAGVAPTDSRAREASALVPEQDAPGLRLAPGPWRAVLESPGGELPFGLLVADDGDVFVLNGRERIRIPVVRSESDSVVLEFPHFDSRLTATPGEGGKLIAGTWEKRLSDGWTRMAFRAEWGDAPRFRPIEGLEPADATLIAGTWDVDFSSTGIPAVARFAPLSGSKPSLSSAAGGTAGGVEGTFLTTTGDYRFLAGSLVGDRLRLSCFDGAHAFLFHATRDESGKLAGDFWSRESWHETWTAESDPDAALPDAFSLTRWKTGASLADAVFPDLDGELHAVVEYALGGRGLIVQLFGSWCPNCHDETVFLTDLHRRYRARGLRVVGLAFELTGESERDRQQVRHFVERHGVEYPILLAGEADKELASESFPALDAVRSFPTTLFFRADGSLRAVHQGFTGPATGPAYDQVRSEFTALAEELVREDVVLVAPSVSAGAATANSPVQQPARVATLEEFLTSHAWVDTQRNRITFGPGPALDDGSGDAVQRGLYVDSDGDGEPVPLQSFGSALFWGGEPWRADREAGVLLSPLDSGLRWVPEGSSASPLIAALGLDYWDGYAKAAENKRAVVRREAIYARVRSQRVAAVSGTGQLGLVGFRELSALLEDPDVGVRTMAAWAAGELRETSARAALEHAATSPNAALRREALRALERLSD